MVGKTLPFLLLFNFTLNIKCINNEIKRLRILVTMDPVMTQWE